MKNYTDLIKSDEGLELLMYTCSMGYNTVGYGHNMDSVPISKQAAEQILDDDIKSTINDCLSFPWFSYLDDVRSAVVINMVFNMGLPTFAGFKKTIRYIEMGLFTDAAEEMLDSKWARQVGSRAPRLAFMMKTGKWSGEV